jgi:hypothetical protein
MMGRGFEVQGPHQQPNASNVAILTTYMMVVKVYVVLGHLW